MAWNIKSKDFNVKTKGLPISGSGNIGRGAVAYKQEWSTDRAVSEGLNRVTWVYRCVDAIASNAARQQIILRDGNPWDGEPITDHPLYALFNSQANVGEASVYFRYRLSAQFLLSRKGVFVEIVKSNGGDVLAFNLLPPEFVTPIKDQKNFVSGYQLSYKTIDQNGNATSVDKRYKPDQIVWIRRPHPFDPYASLIPLDSIGMTIETDWLAKAYNRNFLLNDGRPGGMVIIKGDMMEEDKEELRSRFGGGVERAGRISVIASDDGADFVDTAVTPRDAQYGETRKLGKEEILMGFGVPESVLANASQRTLDNADTERLVFWQETMLPHMDLIYRPFDILDDDPTTYVSYDLSRVDILQRMEMKRREFLFREFDGGGTTLDEYRQATAKETLDNEFGSIFWMPKTKFAAFTLDGTDIPTSLTPDALAPTPNPVGKPNSGDQGAMPGEQRVQARDERLPALPNTDTTPAAQLQDDTELTLKQQEIIEQSLERWKSITETTVGRIFDRVERVVAEKIGGPKFRKEFMARKSVDDLVNLVFDEKVWTKQIHEDLEPVIKGLIAESIKHFDSSYDTSKITIGFNTQKIIDALRDEVKSILSQNLTIDEMVSKTHDLADAAYLSDPLDKAFKSLVIACYNKSIEILAESKESQLETFSSKSFGNKVLFIK